MRLHALQHVPFEGLGTIANWVLEQGHQLTSTQFYKAGTLPSMQDFDGLIIMGGPMNIYEDNSYPWLAAERRFIKEAVDAGKSAVGICLGAQLLADALGSPVFAGKEKEIGWWPISLTEDGKKSQLCSGLPPAATVFHWHGDTFNIPKGAVHLAESQGCSSQAFLFEDRILGLQFHLEATPETVDEILAHCSNELKPAKYIQTKDQIKAAPKVRFQSINTMLNTLLTRLF